MIEGRHAASTDAPHECFGVFPTMKQNGDALKRILIVDEDPRMLSNLAKFLELWGFSASVLAEHQTVKEFCVANNHALVLMDMPTSNPDVLDNFADLRATLPRQRIICMSSNAMLASLAKLGADAMLIKPIVPNVWFEKIQWVLDQPTLR